MTEQERAIVRILDELQQERFAAQGEQMVALRQATASLDRAVSSLERAHAILGKLFNATAQLADFS